MTSAEIESQANRGNLATADMDVRKCLRREVVRDFYQRIGKVSWRRKTHALTFTLAAGKIYDLPDSFLSIVEVYVSGDAGPIAYIGEDPILVAKAELNTTPARPSTYYIVPKLTGTLPLKTLKLGAPSDATYSGIAVYESYPYFADDTTVVDLDQFIPEEFQYALVKGLRAQIYMDRFGEGDTRYAGAQDEYSKICASIAENYHDLARRNYAVYSR